MSDDGSGSDEGDGAEIDLELTETEREERARALRNFTKRARTLAFNTSRHFANGLTHTAGGESLLPPHLQTPADVVLVILPHTAGRGPSRPVSYAAGPRAQVQSGGSQAFAEVRVWSSTAIIAPFCCAH